MSTLEKPKATVSKQPHTNVGHKKDVWNPYEASENTKMFVLGAIIVGLLLYR